MMETYNQLIKLLDEAAREGRISEIGYTGDPIPGEIDNNGRIIYQECETITIKIESRKKPCQSDR